MKYNFFIALGLLISCKQGNTGRPAEKQNELVRTYAGQLIESGFLDYADTLRLDTLKEGLLNSFDIYDDTNNKIVHVDAEELAEFNFHSFLPRIRSILDLREFDLKVQPANDVEETNDILINGESVNLYTKQELEEGDFWDTASRNFFRALNSQLKTHNVDESFYLIYGGNDLHAILLTSKQLKIIAQRYGNDSKETPYTP